MKKINLIAGAAFFLILVGCQQKADKNPLAVNQVFSDQANLIKLVKETELADKERTLVHVSHSCNLIIDKQVYAVIDMRELVKGATTPRGVNQIILLNPEHQLVNKIEYGQARPLFCENNKLYLYSNLLVDGQTEEGNVLQFTDSGFAIAVTKEDLNNKLPQQP